MKLNKLYTHWWFLIEINKSCRNNSHIAMGGDNNEIIVILDDAGMIDDQKGRDLVNNVTISFNEKKFIWETLWELNAQRKIVNINRKIPLAMWGLETEHSSAGENKNVWPAIRKVVSISISIR